MENGGNSSPAVDGSNVYVTYPDNYYAFNRTTGAPVWHDALGGYGGGGRTPVVADGHLFIRDWSASPLIASAATGATQGPLASTTVPAIAGGTAYEMTGALGSGTLQSVASDGLGTTQWSFSGDGHLSSAPLVTSNAVWVGSTSGEIYELSCATGGPLWSTNVGSPINAPDEQNVSQPLTGLGVGGNTLIVPAGSTLIAYTSSSTAGAGSCGTFTGSGSTPGPGSGSGPGSHSGGQALLAPNTKITRATIASKRHRATFRFKGIGETTGFQCALIKRPKPHHKRRRPSFRSCRSPKSYKHLARGRYTFLVRAHNSGGADPTPATKSFTIR